MNGKIRIKLFMTALMPVLLLTLSACGATVTTTIKTKAEEVPKETSPATGEELISGGDFMEAPDNWGVYTESGGSAHFDISGGHGVLSISDPGKVAHGVQLYYDGFELLEGGKYRFCVKISSDVPRTFEWRVQQNGGDYHAGNVK